MSEPASLDLPPGIVKSQSAIASAGRYIDCDGVRFWKGKPQKLGGQVALSTAPFLGYPRGMGAWNDITGRQLLSLGTNLKLYMIATNDLNPLDITPLVSTATLTNPFTTVLGSNLVTCVYNAHGAVLGQYLDFSGATTVNGVTMNGSFPIAAVIDANTVSIMAATVATGSGTGGGTVAAGIEIPPGVLDPITGYGWGAGAWGAGAWGTPRAQSDIVFTPRYWTLDHFGKILLACPQGGGIYSFDPTAYPVVRAAIIPTAPTVCTGIVGTSDYFVIAFGTNFSGTQNYMEWWSCAQGNYTNWDVTAFAGPSGSPSVNGTLASGTEIVGAADLGIHITLMWTDTSLYAFQFTGGTFVFDIQLIGEECGLSGPLAATVVGTVAYWRGNNNFYMYNGGVSKIPNQDDVNDWVNGQIPAGFGIKTVASYNERYGEIWFEIVGSGQSEPTISVVYNIDGQFWYICYSVAFSSATRFTGEDDRPIFAKTDGYVYQIDNGLDIVSPAGTAPQNWYLMTAPMSLGQGVQSYGTDYLAIDMQRQVGTIAATFDTYDRTQANAPIKDTQTVTFTPNDPNVNVRVEGRFIQVQFSGSGLGCDFRLGAPQLAIYPTGERP